MKTPPHAWAAPAYADASAGAGMGQRCLCKPGLLETLAASISSKPSCGLRFALPRPGLDLIQATKHIKVAFLKPI